MTVAEVDRVTAEETPPEFLGPAVVVVPSGKADMLPDIFDVMRNCGAAVVADAGSDGVRSAGAATISPTRAAGTQSSPVSFSCGLATSSHSPSRPSTVKVNPVSTRVRMRPPTPGLLTIGVASC